MWMENITAQPCLEIQPCLIHDAAVNSPQDNERIVFLVDANAKLVAENRRLHAELEEYRRGITLRGWWCMGCDRFNGEEREKTDACRRCDAKKPEQAYQPIRGIKPVLP